MSQTWVEILEGHPNATQDDIITLLDHAAELVDLYGDAAGYQDDPQDIE